ISYRRGGASSSSRAITWGISIGTSFLWTRPRANHIRGLEGGSTATFAVSPRRSPRKLRIPISADNTPVHVPLLEASSDESQDTGQGDGLLVRCPWRVGVFGCRSVLGAGSA